MRHILSKLSTSLLILILIQCKRDPSINFISNCENGWCKISYWNKSILNSDEFQSLDIQDVAFPDDSTIVIAGTIVPHEPYGVVYRSTDLGGTWQVFGGGGGGAGAFITAMFFSYDVGYYQWAQDLGSDQIYKTTDGGITWHSTLSSPVHNSYYKKTALYFVNDDIGFALSSKTIDGGNTWTIMSDLPGDSVSNYFFTNDSIGFATTYTGQFFKTLDCGNSWNIIFNAIGELNSCYFIDSLTGFTGGNNLFKTVDGGNNWYAVSDKNVSDVCFTDSLTGFFVGSNGIYKSVDGGETWTLNYNSGFKNYNAIKFRDKNFGIVVTKQDSIPDGNGYILKTTTLGE